MKYIKNEWLMTWNFFKNNLAKLTLIMGLVFLATAVISWLYFLLNPDLSKDLMQEILAMFDAKDLVNAEGNISAYGLIMNNLQACLISILLGFIPFLFLPMISLLFNAFIIGIMGSFMQTAGMSVLTFLAGIIPHGIFELTALFLSMAMGVFACLQIIRKIRGKLDDLTPVTLMLPLLRVYILIVLPFIIIAGFIEAYITPLIMNAFM